ncbi:hypothetical protein L2E82_29118 [Cichorium intybus]|uniref:Uncharacterized protein n=1 Tax=Cichorium intybus TaxID=13427 RepID=A0ACB9CX54_CICIN|nr:hypothetical protein L2E82_29118 [Cichorium intybus]
MASSSKLRKKSKKLKPHYEMESEDDSTLSNMAMDYEKEKVIAVTFDSIKDSFLIDLCSEKSEFLEHEVENIDDDENLVHLDDDENDDLGLQEGGGLTIISDQHKGLLEAVKEIMPNAEHRQCARHIYANFKKKYNGEEYKNLFWAAASCTVEPEFTSVMEKLKAIDVGAYKYLMSHDKKSWCRAYFCQDRACEAFENGISESFNAMINDARKRPLLTMLEMIRLSVMERVCTMHKLEQSWDGPICPAIIRKLKTFGEQYRFCTSKRPRKTNKAEKERPTKKRLSSYEETVLDLRKSGYDEQEIEELMATTDAQEFDELREETLFDAPQIDLTQETMPESLFDVPVTLHEEEGIEETAIDEVNFVPETIVPGFDFQKIPKVRQKSERITLAKLKKKVDGPGLTQDEPMELD